jgi:glycosyltransferase involved in cell wall biosynthesis
MTRILVLTNMYPPHHYGGYELACRDVVDRWRRRGHDVIVLTTRMRLPDVDDPPDEAPAVLRRLRFYFRDGDLYAPARWRRVFLERSNHRVLDETLRTTRPDVVSIWHMGAMSLSLLTSLAGTGIPLVYVICDDWLSYGPNLDAWTRMFGDDGRAPAPVGRLAERLFGVPTQLTDVGRSGTFCFTSRVTQARSEAAGRWTFPDATVVPLGVDPDVFSGAPEQPGERPWRWRLLVVGRLDERKGVETAVRALAELPETATLEIVGRGDPSYRARLESAAAAVGASTRVSFTTCERNELADRYRAADVLVFPVEWEEPFGMVPLEAMACGTPVVATGAGGSAEFLVDGRNALLFRRRDPDQLAAAVTRLAEDAMLRTQLVTAGLRTAAELTIDRTAAALETRHVGAVTDAAHG